MNIPIQKTNNAHDTSNIKHLFHLNNDFNILVIIPNLS